MNILTTEINLSEVLNVSVNDEDLKVELSDGRTLTVPTAWYPRLQHGTPRERNNWRLIGGGQGIHWEDLDEDISLKSLISGLPSGETQKSLEKWLNQRQ